MKCFYAPNQDAVGACKSCGRGLLREHLTEMSKGLACKDRCEEDVCALITMIKRCISSSKATNLILKRSSASGYGTGAFMATVGIVFSLTGLHEPELIFALYLGVGFLAYGAWFFVRAYRHARIVAKLPDVGESVK